MSYTLDTHHQTKWGKKQGDWLSSVFKLEKQLMVKNAPSISVLSWFFFLEESLVMIVGLFQNGVI